MILDFNNLVRKYHLNINGVIHIGAHIGDEYKIYKRHNIHNIMFFEPVPNLFNRLLINVGKGNAVFHNKALGNKIGKDIMYLGECADNSGCSSLLEPDIFLRQYPHIIFQKRIEVDVDKLDNIIYDRNLYNFINIDVQGYELEVFKGASESLKHIDYIMSEINKEHLYKNCVLEPELDSFLLSFGFIRVETNWEGRNWGDAFYISTKNK